MENKSLFVAIILALALVAGFFFYDEQVKQLEYKLKQSDTEIEAIRFNANSKDTDRPFIANTKHVETTALEDLNNQLIITRSALKETREKLSLATSKSSVLNDEIIQIKDTRGKVKLLKTSLKGSQQKLKISDKKLNYLKNAFESQNKNTITKNIERIEELQETAASIGIGTLFFPIVGIAILTSYTVEEISNYCANIKNVISLEEKVFGEIVSLDTGMQKKYHQKCITSANSL